MKPFITPDISSTGKKVLLVQCEGVGLGELWTKIGNHNVVAYSMPKGQSLRASWLFRLILENDHFVEFSSASTMVVDWHEAGSLNIRLIKRPTTEAFEAATITISPICVTKLEKIVYEDSDVISECGLVVSGKAGEEIVISAGVPPGSVSVSAPFDEGQFEPQFDMTVCTRERV